MITNIPTPYRIPLFNQLSARLRGSGISLKVVFGAVGYARRKWTVNMSEYKFEYEVLPSRKIRYSDPEKSGFTYSGLYGILSKENPSLVISNGFSMATTKLWWRSWFRPIPYLIWSGDIHREGRPYSMMRRLQRKLLIKRASGFIAYGTKAKEYLVSMGASPDKIRISINTVDTEFFTEATGRIRQHLIPIHDKKRLLYIGHLSSRKNVDDLLKIIQVLSRTRSDFVLDIVGDGEDGVSLKKYVRENRLADFVEFHGYKQKSEIPFFMARACCFVFPTRFDIWGLVLNEAMVAGLPCLASVHAGATHDLIEDGVTGFAMDFSQTEKMAERISWLLENPDAAKQIGQNANRFITEHASLEKSASGLVKSIITSMRLKCISSVFSYSPCWY